MSSITIEANMSDAIPQYLKIRQYVFGLIANAKAGGGSLKVNTEAEFCGIFGVSRITVRKALSQLVDEGFLVRKQSLGTFIRPEIVEEYNMHIGKKLAIGVICGDGMITFLPDYYTISLGKIFERLNESGCFVRLIYFNGNAEQEAGQLSKGKLDGIIWLTPGRKSIPTQRIFKSCNIPLVSVFPSFISDEFDCVATDYYKSGYMVAKYLLGRGHRKIIYINNNPPDVEAKKKAGSMAAFAECGVEWNDQLWHCSTRSFTKTQIQSILNDSGDFSAVNCHTLYTDYLKQQLADRKDVQIISNICRESVAVSEGMPGILLPVAQAGSIAAGMLLEKIKQADPPDKVRQLFLDRTIIEPDTYKLWRALPATQKTGNSGVTGDW